MLSEQGSRPCCRLDYTPKAFFQWATAAHSMYAKACRSFLAFFQGSVFEDAAWARLHLLRSVIGI